VALIVRELVDAARRKDAHDAGTGA
jgi:hypothetical protein